MIMKTQITPKKTVEKKARVTQKSRSSRSIMSMTGSIHDEKTAAMNSLLPQEEIASRAYKIWQEQGCPEGFDEMHWRLAEQELLSVSSEGFGA